MFLSNKLNIYFIIVPILGLLLLGINYFLAASNSYSEKDGPFECGFTSFSQSRSAFSVAFILIAILFLPFDLEISSILPYVISIYNNNLYGLLILYLFLIILIIGFIFEINKHALYIIKYFNFKINDLYRNLN